LDSWRGGYPDRVFIAGAAFATMMDSPKVDYYRTVTIVAATASVASTPRMTQNWKVFILLSKHPPV
jgi:hypothetical protein